ncbi:unnamed protein product [Eruca vesicaria subsp. sativa]|uniref:Rab-GAP TBC domain-containing protein n=1 Tax=Eruca vesicaria subsp. sativa TaxID=29727 RepID=A0ABC8KSJ0_ERUVS|nr:unnamed protein product [Eruca vesicaria subsp. sativa]
MKALRRSHTSTSSSANSSSTSLPSTTSTSPPSSNSSSSSSSSSSSWIHIRSVLFVANPSSSPSSVTSSDRSRRKSPWSRRKRKRPLTPHQWRSLFTPEGKLRDGGVGFLKRVRSRGVDPSIRAQVWLFLLGVYDLNSTSEEREAVKTQRRNEYEKLQRRCKMLLKRGNGSSDNLEEMDAEDQCVRFMDDYKTTRQITNQDVVVSAANTDSSDTDSCEDDEDVQLLPSFVYSDETKPEEETNNNSEGSSSPPIEFQVQVTVHEDFSTWQRIIRLDALRADSDWANYSLSSTTITETKARGLADSVALKDYDHLETCRLYHAARLVAILEAYALYDPEIGYCQGMSDLLSPILAVISEDHEAFWCFVGFMKKARHNFRLDEAGIQRQLRIISKIIKSKDSQLYKHLENLQAEDCSFVYRMVLVMFRRELSFEQTLCLWEVMWADQAAIRAGVGKSPWSRIRHHAPPTDDLLLYAIAALVLRRKLIIQRYSSMDEIVEECNSMAGQLDVWKLLDDAHHLVVTLHDKIETLSSQSLSV